MARPGQTITDPEQEKKARDAEKFRRESELKDLKAVLGTREGRNVIWRILEDCKAFATIWDPSARIHFNAGKHDLGIWLLNEVTSANDEALLLMMREAKHKEKQDA